MSRDHGFESWRHILDGHYIFSHLFVVKNCIVCLKRPTMNEKEAGVGQFLEFRADDTSIRRYEP